MCISPSYQYFTIPNDGKTIYNILNKSNVRLKVLEDGRIIMCNIDPDVIYIFRRDMD